MGKIVKAVKPFIYKNNSNFKLAVYQAWVEAGGKCVGERPCEHLYESLSYHLPLPTFYQSKKQARLRFVEAANLPFDTFPQTHTGKSGGQVHGFSLFLNMVFTIRSSRE